MAKDDRKLTVVAVPDLHFPFHSQKKLDLLYKKIQKIEPDIVVQLGDVLDMYAQARFSKSLDVMTPAEELEAGMGAYAEFWATIKGITRRGCRRIQLGGNHTDRVHKLAMDKAPELLPYLKIKENFKIPGVELHLNSRHELMIEGVLYIHGWLSKSFAHAKYFNRPVVHGHLHSAEFHMENLHEGKLWSMSCGYLADPHQTPLLYRATKTEKWVHGFGVVDKDGPRFINL
jgi:UDP-2,3-diacylglucosamine pyrophosphatase LpxH